MMTAPLFFHILSKSLINPYPANVDNMRVPTNASKWRMGINSAFKGLIIQSVRHYQVWSTESVIK